MTESELDKLMQGILDAATEILSVRKRVMPMLHIFKDKKWDMVPLPFEDDETKHLLFFAARQLLTQIKPEAAVFVMEARSVEAPLVGGKNDHGEPFDLKGARKAAGLEGINVSEHPDRKEELIVIGALNGSRQARSKEILRTPGGDPYVEDAESKVISHGVCFSGLFDGVFELEPEIGRC